MGEHPEHLESVHYANATDMIVHARDVLGDCVELIERMIVAGDSMKVGEIRKVLDRAHAAQEDCSVAITFIRARGQ